MGGTATPSQGYDPLISHGVEKPQGLRPRKTRQSSNLRIRQRPALTKDGLHAQTHRLSVQGKLAIGLGVAAQEIRQVASEPVGRASPPALRSQIPPFSQGDKPGGSLPLRQLKPLSRRPPVKESPFRYGPQGDQVVQLQAPSLSCLRCNEPSKG